ncbi:FadR/GntR family transcriptional regulator [Mesorhizobium sp. ASY16-5R]|uniref:FadR/GntR family transcriptional regulator n=1 Tax=Mesorhizobium sp. ASY16-5R TaxID=3445772 RepID=UPI003F9F0E43
MAQNAEGREAGPGPGSSLADVAYQNILAHVIGGHFPVNSRLPSETKLAAEVGVSRPVLRMALSRLKADGVLASRQGSGNYVIRQPHRTVLDFTGLSALGDVQNCFKFRVGVEGEAAYYAALNHDQVGRERIERAYQQLRAAVADGSIGVDVDLEFHLQIAAASGNQFFLSALEAIRDQIAFGVSLTRRLSLRRSHERLEEVENEHQLIRRCIFEREAEAAREAMRGHLENARRRLFEGDLDKLKI